MANNIAEYYPPDARNGIASIETVRAEYSLLSRSLLGADPAQIRDQFMALGLRLLFWGPLAGLLGAWWTGRAMQSVLYDVLSLQAPTLAITFIVVSVVTILASFVPANRAAQLDPIDALRSD